MATMKTPTIADLGPTRRGLLFGVATLPLVLTGPACAKKERRMAEDNGTTLVAYLTRSGNTRVIADGTSRMRGTRSIEIVPRTPYPADYQAHVDQAQRERDSGTLPAIRSPELDLSSIRTLYLGFPIWGGTVPQVVRSFLSLREWDGTSVRPFITHGGYGIGDSRSVLDRLLPKAHVAAPFVLEMDQERRTLEAVRGWLEG